VIISRVVIGSRLDCTGRGPLIARACGPRVCSLTPSKLPRQQLVDPIDFVLGDAAKDIGSPGLWIDTIELCCLNERVGNGFKFSSALSGVVVVTEAAIAEIWTQLLEAGQAIADRTGQR